MLLPLLAVLGSIISLCVGSSYAKQLFTEIGPEGATAFRVGLAAVMLILFWRPWTLSLNKENAKIILLYGITLGTMNLLFYLGIARIPMGVAIAIEFIGPLTLAIFSSRRALDFVWIAIAVLGLAFLLPFKSSANNLDLLGVIYILGAALFWALYIIIGKRAGHVHAGQVTSLGLLIASIIVVPFGIVRAGAELLNPHYFLIGSMVALLSSAIPYSLELYALKRMPKQTFGILLSLEPAVGAISAWIILNEVLTGTQWFAIACIIVASIGCTIGIKRDEDIPLTEADGISE